VKPLAIDYLGINLIKAIESVVEHKLNRLKQVGKFMPTQIKLANVVFSSKQPANYSYLVGVSLYLSQEVELHGLRLAPGFQDDLMRAIANVFALPFRQLTELQVEKDYLLHA